jgi:hypothetical protein
MSEIEYPTKTCTQCGTKCDLLVLVCPNCTLVLPDGKLPADQSPAYEFPANEFPASSLTAQDMTRSEATPRELTSRELPPAIIPESASTDIAIGKIVLFLVAFAILIWLVSNLAKHTP